METEIVHRRTELAIKLVRFVYGDLEHVDTCKLRGAFLFFLPVLVVKTVKFLLWDFWKTLLGISEGLFGLALGFTVASLLAGLSIGLWFADPVLLAGFWLRVGIAIGVVLGMLVVFGGTLIGDEYLASPNGKKFLVQLGDNIESAFHRFADSLPGRVSGFLLKIAFFPVRVVAYYLFWNFICRKLIWETACRENKDTLGGVLLVLLFLSIICAVTAFFIILFIADTLGTTIVVSSLLFAVFSAIGLIKFFRSGTWRALREGFDGFKDRVCRPVKVID